MTRSPDDIAQELLVVRCRRRDSQAWNELIERYNDRLFYFVRRLVSDEEGARSVMQEVWVQALRSFRHLKSPERLTSWLYTIARRTAFNHYRGRCATFSRHEEATIENAAEEDDATERLENAELVHFGLNQLELPEREVLTLYFLEAFSVAEIGGILQIPAGTVKSRLSRARSQLRQILEHEAGPKGSRQ